MNLRSAITLAAHIATSKQALPILATVRICNGRVIATDTVQQIEIPVELPKGIATADLCIHAQRLQRILKALPEDTPIDIRLVKGAQEIVLTAGATKYRLKTLNPEDFPTLAAADEDPMHLALEAKPFIDALKFAMPAMAWQDVRYYLNGAQLAIGGAALIITATDGLRLHRASLPIEPDKERKPAQGIIGAPTVAHIIELTAQHQDMEISLGATQLTIHAHTETITLKLIDGEFPSAERVIPDKRLATAGVPREAFAAAIGRVAQIFTATASKAPAITLGFFEDAITIHAQNTEGEIADERFEWNAGAKPIKGLALSFQTEFLTDALNAFTGERVNLHLPQTDSESLYLTDDGDGGDGARQAVVMPMRI